MSNPASFIQAEAPPGPAAVLGICTFNRGPSIARTLEAVAALDHVAGRLNEVVIVDNRSTDDTAGVVDAFIAAHPGLNMRRVHEPEPGKVAAMRRLFRETSQPLVLTTDDDTLPGPAWARAMIRVMDEHPRAGVVGGPVFNIWESGPTPLAAIYRASLGDQQREARPHRLDNPREFVIGASLGIRRRALVESGWLEGCILQARTGVKLECGAEDAEICIRARQAGWEVWYDPQARVEHLIPPSRQTVEYLARLRGAICRGEPRLRWLAEGRPPAPWPDEHYRKARRLLVKTLLFDLRPTRRRIRLAERTGRLEGWRALKQELDAAATPREMPARRG